MDARELVDYAGSLDCIHCGLCLASCPTYRLTGRETSSPRGRIFLMRAVGEERAEPNRAYAEELDFCLVCRNCESVCPAGVRFGEMMETARDAQRRAQPGPWWGRLARWAGFRAFLPHRLALRLAFGWLRVVECLGLVRLAAWLLGERGDALRALPRVPRWSERALLGERSAARGDRRGAALVFEGCAMPELFGRVNRATVATLTAAGIECHCPRDRSACCGALHAHNGDMAGARRLARRTIATYGEADPKGAPVVVNSAGCGAHMKEYGRLLEQDADWAERARAFSARVVDYTEYLARHADALDLELAAGALPGPVTWDDPCHLCHGQGVRSEPRALLDRVRGLERVELAGSESCCGSAGIYALLRPSDSQAVFEEKLAALRASGARTLVTANPGCQMQWETGLARAGETVEVRHVAEVLARALASRTGA